LIKGCLEEAFEAKDYEKIKGFIAEARTTLQDHLLSMKDIIRNVKSDFESHFGVRILNFYNSSWAEEFAENVFPNIDMISRMVEGAEEAFKMPYLFRNEISQSFIEYIEKMIASDKDAHFACYGFLGQSSCSGKSRLLSEHLETDSRALFIVNINCKPKGELMGYPLAGSDYDIVNYIKKARSFNMMSNIISTILYLVFERAFEKREDGYYLKIDGLSKSLDELGIHYQDIAHPLKGAVGTFLHQASQNLKVRRGNGTKKVILLIAFDEAGYFIDENFSLVQAKDGEPNIDPLFVPSVATEKKEHIVPTILNTFRLIRRVLSQYKNVLWHIPFIFAGTNTRFANFIPSKWNNPSARTGFGPNDERWDGVTLFDPYVLLAPFDVYARQFNKIVGIKTNWKDYIFSPNYMYHLCNIGRPIWGGLLNAGLKKQLEGIFVENPGTGPCIPLECKQAFDLCLEYSYEQAAAKISYDKDEKKDLQRIENAVALMNVIAGAGWISGPLAHTLVERRMAVLMEYRYDTSQSRVIYPSEPILAITALTQFLSKAAAIIQDVIISNDCSTGSTGQIGELVSRIILLLGLDGIDPFHPVLPLRTFLGNLIGDDGLKELEDRAIDDAKLLSILNGYVSFSHFARIHQLCRNSLSNIGLLVNLNAALCAQPNYPGIDNLIPVVLEGGSLGCVSIQVKSLADKLCPSEIRGITSSMALSGFFSVNIPNLNIILNVCPYIEYSCHLEDPSYPTFDVYTLVIQGISGMAIFQKPKYMEVEDKLLHILKINRFEVDFRDEKRKLLPITTNFPEYRRRTWEDWEELQKEEDETVLLKQKQLEEEKKRKKLQKQLALKGQQERSKLREETSKNKSASAKESVGEVSEKMNLVTIGGESQATKRKKESRVDLKDESPTQDSVKEAKPTKSRAKRGLETQ